MVRKTGQYRERPSSWKWLSVSCLMILVGCDSNPAQAPVTKTVVVDIPIEPSQIELTDAKAVLKPDNLVVFEVKYQF